jgi:hypothetical protein
MVLKSSSYYLRACVARSSTLKNALVTMVFYVIIVFTMVILVGTRCYFFKIGLGGDGRGPAMVKVSSLVNFVQNER